MPAPLVELVVSAVIALVVIGLGVYYLAREIVARRRNDRYVRFPPDDRRHFQGQFYRRAVGSTLLVAAGIAIFVGQAVLDWQQTPVVYACLWIGIALGLLGVISLAGADLLSIRRYARRQQQRLNADRREMIARQLELYRAERGSARRQPPDFDVERN